MKKVCPSPESAFHGFGFWWNACRWNPKFRPLGFSDPINRVACDPNPFCGGGFLLSPPVDPGIKGLIFGLIRQGFVMPEKILVFRVDGK
jgi:hypothetical protein